MTNFRIALWWRCLLYVALILCAALVPRLEFLDAPSGQLFTENSAVEIISLLLLLGMIAIYASVAARFPGYRSLGFALSLLCLGAFFRELDYFLDRAIADGAWQVLVSVTLLTLAWVVWTDRHQFFEKMKEFSENRAFGILLAAALTVTVFSRLFGMSVVWESTLLDDYNRSAKNLAEEGVELLGYALLFIGTLEAALCFRQLELQKIKAKPSLP